ncbi:MAG: hypothetical protein K0Q73_6138, partial [Paenibacillus sp.]|nr:hypothetical protein [Paenibacillus sp.]
MKHFSGGELMLTIYNRQKAKVGALQTSGHNMDVYDVAIQRRLNSELSLTFQIPMTSSKYALIEEEGLIECEGQKYVIKKRARNRQGMGRTVQITCQHVMRRMMDIRIPYTSAINEAFGASIYALTNAISAATGGVFTFQIIDTFPVKDVYKWGYSNCLKAFQDLVNLYGAEFVPDNYVIKLYNKINIDNGMQYRYAKNIIDDSFETNTDTLCTRMTGLAKDSLTIIDLPASYLTTDEYNRLNAVSGAIIGGVIKVPYLISQYAAAWATPDNIFFDNEFEDNDIDASTTAGKVLLLEEIRKKLAQSEVPDIQVKVNAADLWKTNTTRAIRPQLGETVFLVDQLMELDNITARIMEMTEYPFDPSKNTSVTLANFLLKDYNDIVSDLNASKNTLDGLLTNKKINAERFEDFARQAVHDIDNSKTEIVYDERGIVLIEKTNLLEQVVLASQGMYLTTDGGLTSRVAITANGIVADEIRVGILRGIRIEGVTIIGS